MDEVDAPPPVKHVQAFHHIIRLTRARRPAIVGCILGALAACGKGRRCPEPSLLGAAKWVCSALEAGGGSAGHTNACKGRHRDVSFLGTCGRRTNDEHKTIGCNFLQGLIQLLFLFPSAQNPIRLALAPVSHPAADATRYRDTPPMPPRDRSRRP